MGSMRAGMLRGNFKAEPIVKTIVSGRGSRMEAWVRTRSDLLTTFWAMAGIIIRKLFHCHESVYPLHFSMGDNLQNRQENGKKDDRPEGITAPEPRPMTPEILRRCALDGLQGNGVRGLDMLEITTINGLLGGQRATMDTQGMFGSGRAEIGGFLGPFLRFAHFAHIG